MSIKKTFLITGGTGFLGSNILKHMIGRGDDLIVLKRSLSNINRISDMAKKLVLYDLDQVDIKQVFCDHRIDKIIHCATNYGRTASNPMEVIEANLMLPLRLLELGKAHKVKCFINTDTILDKRISYYALSKSQFKQWLAVYASEILCLNIELEHFYGPEDDDSKFVTNIVHKLLNQVDKIDLTKGRQKRSFIYIDDAVEAFTRIIDHSDSLSAGFYTFQVGSLETVEIKQFVELVKELTFNKNTVLNFGALPYRENEVMEPRLDLTKLIELGWRSRISLAEGLNKTIEAERINLRR
jgi:nucleoside-diphosphate-sugar epimerase